MNRPHAAALALATLLLSTAAAAQGKRSCPVTGKPIASITKAPMVQVNRKRVYFADAKALAQFRRSPEKYLKTVDVCPVLENPVAKIAPGGRMVLNNNLIYFCCDGCKEGFIKSGTHFKKQQDVVTGEIFEANSSSPHVEYQGQHYLFATDESKATFEKSPEKYAALYGK